MNVEFDVESTKKDASYKMVTAEWQLLKKGTIWALLHRTGCNGYIAGVMSNTNPKITNCSGCGRKVDRNLLSKLPFLIKMDLVNKAWRPDGKSDTSSS